MNLKVTVLTLLFCIMTFPLLSQAEPASQLTIKDALCCYAYNPEPPNEIVPLFIGDAVPENWLLYLPDPTSQIVFAKKEKPGEEQTLKKPGFYHTTGSKVRLPPPVENLIRKKGESCQFLRLNAEGMRGGTKSFTGSFELDDPQRVPSPSA